MRIAADLTCGENIINRAYCILNNTSRSARQGLARERLLRLRTVQTGCLSRGHELKNLGGEVNQKPRSRFRGNVDNCTVNLVVRLGQLNKELGTQILVSTSTQTLSKHVARFSSLGDLRVRGYAEAITV